VGRDVEFVLEKPDDWYPHADGESKFSARGAGGIPSLRIDFRKEHNNSYRILSVYVMDKRQVANKMRGKEKEIAGLVRAGQSPDRPLCRGLPEQVVGSCRAR
jgi:hypothetical protein